MVIVNPSSDKRKALFSILYRFCSCNIIANLILANAKVLLRGECLVVVGYN